MQRGRPFCNSGYPFGRNVQNATYKTERHVLARIRKAMGQKDDTPQLSGVVEFDDAFFGSPTVGKKRGRGAEKAKVFVAVSLDEAGNHQSLKKAFT